MTLPYEKTEIFMNKARTFPERGCIFQLGRYNISTHKKRVLITKGREFTLWKSTSLKPSPSVCWTS